jgi:hypothetical protein
MRQFIDLVISPESASAIGTISLVSLGLILGWAIYKTVQAGAQLWADLEDRRNGEEE